ncbi:bifunctional diaminohydroxyphosphoribosylaminopyrimidine deaminase/5-amino-6-(5-phosphoribosylamino)uracil reductase RibD, partial [Candidatus Daviesbacteria bacterium]|nr:bifunctional diaminohydroxyphosphoribosylaminopyrimidine deaminase/5-amino-6-(5-phosphoribosylamino)uracil reductase RibD [Candidatus Daviesbacteria bacterium]
MNQDLKFLKETLKLAKKGLGRVSPNPMVGAVIVKNGQIIGKGYHKKFGFPHAEIEALKNCRENPRGATMYVNLQPCSHFGKTPPCIDAIIKAGIKKVICCSLDPNPKIHGKAGIEISAGVLEKEARKLNEAFFTFHEKKRPFIAIKFAASLDGKLATRTGDSKWITNEKAREYARSLRARYQAVLVGKNTFLKDQPHLGVRIKGKKDPLKIVLGLSINPKNIQDLLSILYKKEIISVLVEGGGKTLGSFIDAKVVDKVYAFHAPIIIGGE